MKSVAFKVSETNTEKKQSAWLGFEPGTPGIQNAHSATTPAGLHIIFFENLQAHSYTFYRITRSYKRQYWSILSKAYKFVANVYFAKRFSGLSYLIET